MNGWVGRFAWVRRLDTNTTFEIDAALCSRAVKSVGLVLGANWKHFCHGCDLCHIAFQFNDFCPLPRYSERDHVSWFLSVLEPPALPEAPFWQSHDSALWPNIDD